MASLPASLAKVGGNTLLSRILGFARDLVVARLFGADAGTDAFFVAFKIPNFMRRLFAEGAFSMAFVPILNEHREQRGFLALKGFIDDIAGTLGAALLLITALGVLGAPVLVLIFAPGFANDASQWELATAMLRLTFPYLLFISLTAFAGGILNTYDRFGVPAFTPALLNLSLIGGAIWLAPHLERPIMALAWGVLLAGLIQLAFQLPFLAQLNLVPRPRFNDRNPDIRRVIRRMGPALFGVSVAQISLLMDTLLASFLTTGSISWLYYSDRLMEFPLGILAATLGTVILPRLSRRHIANDPESFSQTLDWALRWLLLLGVPSAIGLLTLAGPLMATLFHSNEFGADDVTMASHSLMAYSLGLIGFMGIKVLTPGYYARQEMRTPVRIAVIALLVGIGCNLVLMIPLGHSGLALGTTIAATINAGLLLRGLLKQGILIPRPGWTSFLARVLAANLAMGILVSLGTGSTADWIAMTARARAWHLLMWIAIGASVYLGALLALGLRPKELRASS
ncbi:murein biosynthesis integral membrane protein MurJ [Thiocystis minor]|uniref:murein biosynthesis integral membrane protein MurJ n=1 Tax=Thiocystis minor TaxID=61597 RepID=UPI0019124E86|nr:murein biosynthesis integral membrane protein MurJ [Thiocystis minor]MBK5963134.1 murein biosynthesis integral membrane protein MurJ [Thiocystis minor]